MMKLRNLLGGAALAALVFTGCGDDTSSIYLIRIADHAQITDGKIELSSFSTGDKYLIRGGEGNYLIRNENEKIMDYRYDGDTLTLIPVSIGEATAFVADRSGNSCTLSVSIHNPKESYLVDSLSATVTGDDLTKGEEAELQARIAQDAPVQPGGGFLFTYTDVSLAYGDIKLFPQATGNYEIGLFERSLKYTEETGEPYQQIKVEMAGSTHLQYTFMLIENEASSPETASSTYLLKEEVTAQYNGEFRGLTKAYRVYHLIKQ